MLGVRYTGHIEKKFITHKQLMLNIKNVYRSIYRAIGGEIVISTITNFVWIL